MRSRLCHWFIGFLFVSFMAGCGKVPSGVLSEKKMQAVLTDMQLAEAMINMKYDSFPDNMHKEALYQSVFEKHNITQAVYDSSLVWFGMNLHIYMEIYDRVLVDVNQRITDLGDVQANTGFNPLQDSLEIWPRPTSLRLHPQALFNGAIFEVIPETYYPSGSSFVLGMDVWGINNGMKSLPQLCLAVDQRDTTLTVHYTISKEGYQEFTLKSLPTKQIRRVYGYIRMDNQDATYSKVFIDRLTLKKYNYVLNQATDSIH